MTLKVNTFNNSIKFFKMKKDQIKRASDFLGLKKLTPLENKAIRGGLVILDGQHVDQDGPKGHHHIHHD
jgi:hypothetical protein